MSRSGPGDCALLREAEVPLSDHEQRLLEQIEQALYAEDPKFAHHYRSTDLRTLRRSRLVRLGVLWVLGGGLLGVGIWRHLLAMTAGGGAVLLVALALTAVVVLRFRPARPPSPTPPTRSVGRRSLRRRLEDRWERRWEQRGL